jgi:uncharacterized coiled-coil protein SlyX
MIIYTRSGRNPSLNGNQSTLGDFWASMIEASNGNGVWLNRRIIAALLLVFLVAGGWSLLRGYRSTSAAAVVETKSAVAAPGTPTAPVSPDLIEATKALAISQQQAIDQLQVVQDLLTAQRTETKRLSDEVETLNGKLSALQETVANMPAPGTGTQVPLPKPAPPKNADKNADKNR